MRRRACAVNSAKHRAARVPRRAHSSDDRLTRGRQRATPNAPMTTLDLPTVASFIIGSFVDRQSAKDRARWNSKFRT
ncbi:hypothetical protein BURMUCF2_3079 [Burkholderia multivorans CF2]|nr:hypothetical protein BURMUCF2_3079 [Burkholderia multivorans CF2]